MIENTYTKITNNKKERPIASLGYHTELITFLRVGYLIRISVKWKEKKNG